MPKFSIIIPVYNTAEYLSKCFDSILSQTLNDYEVIIVNDGSSDNSQEIIDKYVEQHNSQFKSVSIENSGPGQARNVGIEQAVGEYLLFVDSDDYIEKDLLKKLNLITNDAVDLVRFQIKTVDNAYNLIEEFHEKEFTDLTGPQAFEQIVHYKLIDLNCCYLYNRRFYQKNKFKFKKGVFHEDFGLIPYIIMKANSVISVDYLGYNYVQRNNSIMNTDNYVKTKKKVEDFYNQGVALLEKAERLNAETEEDVTIFKSFISNSMILKITELKYKDYKKYLCKARKQKIFDNLLTDTTMRKIKKFLVSLSPKIYYKIMR